MANLSLQWQSEWQLADGSKKLERREVWFVDDETGRREFVGTDFRIVLVELIPADEDDLVIETVTTTYHVPKQR